jgi:DNA-binding GntR family transcriptional regulator
VKERVSAWEIKPESVQEQAANRLRQAILNRDLLIGERLIEADLAERLGVSRGPIREALQRLSAEGLVDHIPRVGRFVHMPTVREVQEVQELRAELESLAARKLADRAGMDDDITWIHGLEETISQMKKSLDRDDLASYFRHSRIFHETMVGLSEMETLIEFHSFLMNRASLFRQLSGGVPQRQEQALEEHIAIVEAIRNKDRELADQLTNEHTNHGTNAILAALQKRAQELGVQEV